MSDPSNADFRSAQLKASFQKLALASQTLNTASGKFADSITTLDEAINKLNIGITAWVNVSSSSPTDSAPNQYFEERVGYAKTNGRWGLSLCTVNVLDVPDGLVDDVQGLWLYNDAPRELRLRALKHVPELIDNLASEALRTASSAQEQAELAFELAKTVSAALAVKQSQR